MPDFLLFDITHLSGYYWDPEMELNLFLLKTVVGILVVYIIINGVILFLSM